MTRRCSVRAAAREIYGELAKGRVASAAKPDTPTPDPSPLKGGGEKKAAPAEGAAPDLTARVRALYEGSAVPVREIAAIAGVSERTIYKYAAKGCWTKRYRDLPRGEAAAAANRGRRRRAASDFTPGKGAGGRFIRRADIGKAFAQGLKATDPLGRSRAAAACDRAEVLACLAQARAEADKRHDALLRAIDGTTRAFAILRAIRQKAAGRRRMPPNYALLERVAIRHVEAALRRWQRIAATVAAC
jgi:hypothetical protein